MQVEELEFSFPEYLIAQKPALEPRCLWACEDPFQEITKFQLLKAVSPGDAFVINVSRVEKRRVFSVEGFEILFVKKKDEKGAVWEVLFPARKAKEGQAFQLPGGVKAILLRKGMPQVMEVSKPLSPQYFDRHGEMALPPYIQKQRSQRHTCREDSQWYQTAWGREWGSCASPTASLHFQKEDLEFLRQKGVHVLEVVLHVGLGTFLPVRTPDLNQHKMHEEEVYISSKTLEVLERVKKEGGAIWTLGTTVMRALESWKKGFFQETERGVSGWTDLFITPGFEFQVGDYLLTNFHQPRSTLLALVMAFAGKDKVKRAYQWAIQKEFRLFSYGDLSVWKR